MACKTKRKILCLCDTHERKDLYKLISTHKKINGRQSALLLCNKVNRVSGGVSYEVIFSFQSFQSHTYGCLLLWLDHHDKGGYVLFQIQNTF